MGSGTRQIFVFLVLVTILDITAAANLTPYDLIQIINANKILDPNIMIPRLQTSQSARKLMKDLLLATFPFKLRDFDDVSSMRNSSTFSGSLILITDEPLNSFEIRKMILPSSFTKFPLLIVTNNSDAWRTTLDGQIKINQMVYVFDRLTWDQHEIYTINKNTVWQRLLYLNAASSLMASDTLATSNFLERRMNFYGIHLKVMVARQAPFNLVPTDEQRERVAIYHKGNATYDVTGLVTGPFQTVLETMAARMNFTFSSYTRKDGWWGALDTDEQGNTYWRGMVQNLMEGEADLCSASLTFTPSRASVVDFLRPFAVENYQLVMRKEGIEDISWRTYRMPFRLELWYALAAMIFSFWVLLQTFETLLLRKKEESALDFQGLFGNLWLSFAANFNWKPTSNLPNESSPLAWRCLMTSLLLSGTVISCSYRASLTSELAVRWDKLPFDSLETLLRTDYMLYTQEGTVMQMHFDDALEGSTHEALKAKGQVAYVEEVDDMINLPKSVIYGPLEMLTDRCGNVPVWQSPHPSLIAMAVGKDSPYKAFFDRFISNMQEAGPIQKIQSQTEKEAGMLNCGETSQLLTGKEITLEKIFTLFLMLGIGGLAAIEIMVIENLVDLYGPKKKVDVSATEQNEFQRLKEQIISAKKSLLTLRQVIGPKNSYILDPIEMLVRRCDQKS